MELSVLVDQIHLRPENCLWYLATLNCFEFIEATTNIKRPLKVKKVRTRFNISQRGNFSTLCQNTFGFLKTPYFGSLSTFSTLRKWGGCAKIDRHCLFSEIQV